jgi:putative phosphoribosyl transferase
MTADAFGDLRSPMLFHNRLDAGEQLATMLVGQIEQLAAVDPSLRDPEAFVVYALPRGGVEVAMPIAQRLHCPLSVIVAKKITRPENPEYAIGAVSAQGKVVWQPRSRAPQPIPNHIYELALHEARDRAQEQWQHLSAYCPPVNPAGRIALLVDDGIATGMTMAVAAQELQTQNPAEIWICVPVAPPEMMPQLRTWADFVFTLATPSPFQSVSRFYQRFDQLDLAHVVTYLRSQSHDSTA